MVLNNMVYCVSGIHWQVSITVTRNKATGGQPGLGGILNKGGSITGAFALKGQNMLFLWQDVDIGGRLETELCIC